MRIGVIKVFAWNRNLPANMIGVLSDFESALAVLAFSPNFSDPGYYSIYSIEELFNRLLPQRKEKYEIT